MGGRARDGDTRRAAAGGSGGDRAVAATEAAASSGTSKQASYNRADVKIYTRTGDAGETSLFDGTRVSKHDARVDAYGEVDELNAGLGVARSAVADPEIDTALAEIQRDLFAIGARLA